MMCRTFQHRRKRCSRLRTLRVILLVVAFAGVALDLWSRSHYGRIRTSWACFAVSHGDLRLFAFRASLGTLYEIYFGADTGYPSPCRDDLMVVERFDPNWQSPLEAFDDNSGVWIGPNTAFPRVQVARVPLTDRFAAAFVWLKLRWLWLPALLFGIGLCFVRRRHPPEHCKTCGYDCRSLPVDAVCPECGECRGGGPAESYG